MVNSISQSFWVILRGTSGIKWIIWALFWVRRVCDQWPLHPTLSILYIARTETLERLSEPVTDNTIKESPQHHQDFDAGICTIVHQNMAENDFKKTTHVMTRADKERNLRRQVSVSSKLICTLSYIHTTHACWSPAECLHHSLVETETQQDKVQLWMEEIHPCSLDMMPHHPDDHIRHDTDKGQNGRVNAKHWQIH